MRPDRNKLLDKCEISGIIGNCLECELSGDVNGRGMPAGARDALTL